VNAGEFRRYLLALWPHLDIGTLLVVETGWDSLVADVDGRWIFRVPRGEAAARALLVEANLLPELAPDLPARVPVFEFVSIDPPCAGYRRIEGEPLDPHHPPASIGPQLGRFLRALHSFSVDRARALGVPGGRYEWRADLEADCAGFRARVLPLLDGEDRLRAEGLLDEVVNRESNFGFEPALVHADLGSDHILCSDDGLLGVIDWGDVRIGDPAIDFSWAVNSLEASTVSSLIEAYGHLADGALIDRALSRHRLGPWYEVTYGLDSGGEGFVASGLAGIVDRLP
jgi:aminoglycoside phosphotransferase (APT) family kinase protein